MTPSSSEQYQHRPVTSDDVGAILSVVNTHSETHYGDKRWGQDEVRSWFGPDGKPAREDMEIWLNANGEACAYAQICDSEWPPTWDVWLDISVHPESSCNSSLWRDVLEWAERKTCELISARDSDGGRRCGVRILETDNHGHQAVGQRGYVRVRTETLMHTKLDAESMISPEWPDGIQVRALNLGRDLESYSLAYGEAFRDHWGHMELSREELVCKKQGEFCSWGDEFVPELWFVAVGGDEIVGSAGNFLNHGGSPRRSYLYNVFVRRAWRNRGIATALLRHSFQEVHRRGARSAELHVDSENLTWALELYRGVGMSPLWHQHLYERTLPPLVS
jgi:ribosomal protein S18 acetylase RimI-like enzyme